MAATLTPWPLKGYSVLALPRPETTNLESLTPTSQIATSLWISSVVHIFKNQSNSLLNSVNCKRSTTKRLEGGVRKPCRSKAFGNAPRRSRRSWGSQSSSALPRRLSTRDRARPNDRHASGIAWDRPASGNIRDSPASCLMRESPLYH